MKQILLTLSLFLSLSINAQIQRSFLGLTLGEATKPEVKQTLINKCISVEEYNGNITTNDITFGGEKWSHAVFQFYKGKLYSIVFGMSVSSSNKLSVKKDILRVISILKKKYPKFLMIDEEEHVILYDLKTMASVSYTNVSEGVGVYGLTYSDYATLSNIVQSTEDEF